MAKRTAQQLLALAHQTSKVTESYEVCLNIITDRVCQCGDDIVLETVVLVDQVVEVLIW